MDTKKLPPISFYIPQDQWPSQDIPDNIDENWQMFGPGVFASTLQTYVRLKTDGFPCELVGKLPSEGIVIAHRDSIPCNWRPSSRLLFVCIQADREPHPWAHIHVAHNPQALLANNSYKIASSYYIPHWAPQPGLIPRNPVRGEQFENIAFFGNLRNLAPQLQQPVWEQSLQALGLHWRVISSHQWNNYSDVDAVVAIRSFEEQDFTVKPALKLYNAWHAGVPAILGRESAFRAERKSDLDYLEAISYQDAIAMLKQLRDDIELRRAIVANGRRRAEETRHSIHLKMWRDFIQGIAIPAYINWCNASILEKQKFYLNHSLAYNFIRIQRRLLRLNKFFANEILPQEQQEIGTNLFPLYKPGN